MNTPKELFLKNDDLRTKLAAVVSADWFRHCLLYVIAQMHEDQALTAENMHGARIFMQTMNELHQADPPAPLPISTGLKPVTEPKR